MADFPAGDFSIDGEPGRIAASGRKWSAFGAQATEASSQITALDTSLFVGVEGDLYRSGLTEKLPPHLTVTGQAYAKVGSALATFASALTSAQTAMSPLAAKAPALWQAVADAQGAVSSAASADKAHAKARSDAKDKLKPGESMPTDTYSSQASSAASSLSAARKAWDDCHAAALKLKADANRAADTCHDTIHDASGMRFHKNPSGWGAFTAGFKSFVKDHVAGLAKLSAVLKTISAVAGLLSFIPVIGEVAAPIALATGAAALAIDASIKYATGQGSWKSIIIIDGALMALPGVGKLAGKFIKPAMEGGRLAQSVAGGKAFVRSLASDVAETRVGVRVLDTGTGVRVFGGLQHDGAGLTRMLSNAKEEAGIARGRALVGSTPRNARFAGGHYPLAEKDPALAAKYPQGVKFTDEGFPDFAPHATHSVALAKLGPTRQADFAAANKAAGLAKTPKGYTWHHVEDGTTMQLVPEDLHAAVGHTGGWSRYNNILRVP